MVNNLFWGVLVLLFGLSMVVKALFGFTFPILKPLIGVLLIYMGIVMIFNLNHGKNVVRFGNAYFQDSFPARKYSVLFGKGTIDLSRMEIPQTPTHMKINTIFGESNITINKNIPTRIILHSVFADTTLPYDLMKQTGSNIYQLGDAQPLLTIEINVVFGKTKIGTV